MSALPLPELFTGEGRADIIIKLNSSSKCISSKKSIPISCVSACSDRVHLTWGGVGDLLIEEGRQITIIPIPYADEDALRLFTLGAGLGVLLHQRRLLVFHASSVAIHDKSVGIIGAKGWGKSTTAALLCQRGYPLISDELLAIRFDEQSQPWVMPSSPQIKLWEDALIGIGTDPRSAVRVRSGIDKFSVYAKSVPSRKFILHSLYLLDSGKKLSIQPMSIREAFFGIIPHLYIHRFGTPFLLETNAHWAFKQLNLLLKKIAVKRLLRQYDFSQLPDITQKIEQDIFENQVR